MTLAEIVVKELIKGTLDFSLGLFLRCSLCSSLAAAVTQISTQVIRLTLWLTKLLSLVHVCMYGQGFPSLSGQNCGFYLCVGCYVLVCRLGVGYTCFCVWGLGSGHGPSSTHPQNVHEFFSFVMRLLLLWEMIWVTFPTLVFYLSLHLFPHGVQEENWLDVLTWLSWEIHWPPGI